ncbi:Cupin superfamily protein [Haemophilus parahaemolyticus]|uniref:Cupin superfamily protein n=1 Tax=Haemophilus parahaemolyticus TaxID=735 RepID=A0A377HZE7_HAEPH|nr:cupin domain-containing protein [Haemophilus parahaemolyticus]STO63643.1 Cupin superfamily protein [Haemophilus parahaemolyticus]
MSINFSIGYQEFFNEFFEKKPLLIKDAISYGELLSWEKINEVLPRCNIISEDAIKLMYKGQKLGKKNYIEEYNDLGTIRYKFHEENLYSFLRDGATLVANGIVNEPSIDKFSSEVSRFTGCHTFSSLYIAFNTQSSFKSHWDSRDIFALQMQGKKRWIIHAPTFKNPLFMHRSKDMPEYMPDVDNVYMDVVLEAGDILYLPRGWWHDPVPIGEETVHLAIGIFPAYANNYLTWVSQNIVEKEIARESLIHYGRDEKLLEDLAIQTANYIKDKENYYKFIEEFYDKKRLEKPLKLEVFGNYKNNNLLEKQKISFDINNHYFNHNNKIISNGYGIVLDDDFKKVVSFLREKDEVTLEDILNLVDIDKKESISNLIWQLSYIGVLRLT